MGLGKTSGMEKGFKAGAAILANLIVKLGADDDHVIQSAAVGDALLGVAQNDAPEVDDSVTVMLSGIAEVVYGGTVTRGDRLTSDANGKAVTAAPAVGVNNSIIGIAGKSGVLNDIQPVILFPSVMQGA